MTRDRGPVSYRVFRRSSKGRIAENSNYFALNVRDSDISLLVGRVSITRPRAAVLIQPLPQRAFCQDVYGKNQEPPVHHTAQMPGIFLRAQPPPSEAQFQGTDAFSMGKEEGRGCVANADVRVQESGRIG